MIAVVKMREKLTCWKELSLEGWSNRLPQNLDAGTKVIVLGHGPHVGGYDWVCAFTPHGLCWITSAIYFGTTSRKVLELFE